MFILGIGLNMSATLFIALCPATRSLSPGTWLDNSGTFQDPWLTEARLLIHDTLRPDHMARSKSGYPRDVFDIDDRRYRISRVQTPFGRHVSSFRHGTYTALRTVPTNATPDDAPSWFDDRFHADAQSNYVAEVQYGWPMPAFRGAAGQWTDGRYGRFHTPWMISFPSKDSSLFNKPTHPAHVHIPLRPIWFGVFVNSVLYALVAWLMLTGFHSARHSLAQRHARQRGDPRTRLCVRCRYPLQPDGLCPECGLRVKPHTH